MSSARQAILGRIRSGLKRGPLNEQQQTHLLQQLSSRKRTIQPARAKVTGSAALGDFKTMALEVGTEIIDLTSVEQLPQAMSKLMGDSNLAQQPLVLANESELVALNWNAANITTEIRVSTKGDAISLTNSLCGVAETGTLVLRSSPHSPTTLNLFPDIHCAVLYKDNIVPGYEDAWDWVRNDGIPRTVNFITGPSRSADLEQTLRMGAHGPKRLIIFLV
ncbi:MAG: lactate utilization protein C [Gammaproteobacteria bacterium]|nr:lactate utilization protein C [Gammaproteobacteria bacterium]